MLEVIHGGVITRGKVISFDVTTDLVEFVFEGGSKYQIPVDHYDQNLANFNKGIVNIGLRKINDLVVDYNKRTINMDQA